MKTKKMAAFLLTVMMALTGCSGGASADINTETETGTVDIESVSQETDTAKSVDVVTVKADNSYTTEGIDVNLVGEYSDKALDDTWSLEDATVISLSDTGISIQGDGAAEQSGVVTITAKGTYVLQGSIKEGQVVVDAEEVNVRLVLNGASISNSTDAPIYINEAKNVYMTLAEGTENSVEDNRSAAQDEDTSQANETTASGATGTAVTDETGGETAKNTADADETGGETEKDTADVQETAADHTAAIYSKDDLIINGAGTLYVKGGYKDGITCNDDLQIVNGNITIETADDGIVGKDSVSIRGGSIAVIAGDDGLKSTNEETDKGYLIVDGGSIHIESGDKGIDTVNVIVINDGNIDIDAKNEGMESSNVVLNGGEVNVTADDDGINISDGSGSNEFGMGGTFGGGKTDGDRPEMPEGGFGEMADGERPQMPEGGSGEMADGERPEMPEGGFGETADGEKPQMPEGGFGEMADGERPQMPEGGSGEMADGEQPQLPEAGSEQGENSAADNRGTRDRGMRGQGQQGDFGGFGGGMMDQAIDGALVVNGGIITVDSGGDGIDSNGNIQINGGYTIISGTTTGGNAALDYNGTCEINGGVLLLTSAGDMEQRGSSTSLQKMAYTNLDSALAAGSQIRILDGDGNVLYSFTNAKECRYVAVSSPEVTEGAAIQIEAGGTKLTTTIG